MQSIQVAACACLLISLSAVGMLAYVSTWPAPLFWDVFLQMRAVADSSFGSCRSPSRRLARLRPPRTRLQHLLAKRRLRPRQACACPGNVQTRPLPAGARRGSVRVQIDGAD